MLILALRGLECPSADRDLGALQTSSNVLWAGRSPSFRVSQELSAMDCRPVPRPDHSAGEK